MGWTVRGTEDLHTTENNTERFIFRKRHWDRDLRVALRELLQFTYFHLIHTIISAIGTAPGYS